MTPTDRTYAGRVISDRKDERRRRLVEAAVQCFAEHGYSDCSVADICASAGLSKRQFYEEFRTREDILVAVYDLIQEENTAALVAAVSGFKPEPDAHRAIVEILRIYLDTLTADRRRAKVIFVVVMGVSQRVENHRRQTRVQWANLLESLLPIAVGPRATIKGDPLLASATIVGATNGLLQEWLLSEAHRTTEDLAKILAPVVLSQIQE